MDFNFADLQCAVCGERLGNEAIAEVVTQDDIEAAEGNVESGPRPPKHSLIHAGCFDKERMSLA